MMTLETGNWKMVPIKPYQMNVKMNILSAQQYEYFSYEFHLLCEYSHA